MKEKMQCAAEPQEFEFSLSQRVNIRISNESGVVRARAQYANGENQYLVHYQAADRCARTEWFAQSVLNRHSGCLTQ